MPTKKKTPVVADPLLTDAVVQTSDLVQKTKKESVKKAPKKVKKSSLKVEAQLEVKPEPKVKKQPIKVKRLDDPTTEPAEDPAIKLDPFTKKVMTKLVVKDGMVIVEPINNPFDE